MPTYSTQERLIMVLRHLHKTRKYDLKITDIAKALDLPYASVQNTISHDYPECFDRDPFGKGIILSGLPPVGLTWDRIDLEPTAKRITTTKTIVEDIPDSEIKIIKQSDRQMSAEHFQEGWNKLPEPMRMQIKSMMDDDTPMEVDEGYWKAWNYYSAGLIALKVARAPNKRAKLKELVKGEVEL